VRLTSNEAARPGGFHAPAPNACRNLRPLISADESAPLHSRQPAAVKYRSGGGIVKSIMKSMRVVCSLSIGLLSFSGTMWAKEIPEHPVIRPYPDSVLAMNMSRYEDFGEYEFPTKDAKTNRTVKKKVQGKYWHLLYEVRHSDGSRNRDISRLEFFENYKAAVREKGGETLLEDQAQLVFTLPREDGGKTWCRVVTTPNLGQLYLTIIDEKGFSRSLTFSADEMKQALDQDGRIALYGILFDIDKATLQQDSIKELTHMVTLLRQNPDLKLEIQGHTDSQGTDSYNRTLSQKRAETVKSFLQLFGIQGERLQAKGYGETEPVASNDNDEGRARNRRVELVKL
jgi:outer membrane protein OmpA-like peptidoglycan-associated protein